MLAKVVATVSPVFLPPVFQCCKRAAGPTSAEKAKTISKPAGPLVCSVPYVKAVVFSLKQLGQQIRRRLVYSVFQQARNFFPF